MKFPALLRFLPALALLSCASSGDKTSDSPERQKAASGYKPLSQRMDESNGFTVDGDGNWKPKSDKRSSFESQGGNKFFSNKNVAKKEYRTGEMNKKSWWGNKDYGRPAYAGNTDGSRFQTTSRFQGDSSREAGRAADVPKNYQTGAYATGAAREAGKTDLARTPDAETGSRRAVFTTPPEVDYRAIRPLSLEQSKGILGR